jgi:hypothetical protein
LSGVYELPYAISLSGTAQYYKGFPDTTTVLVSGNTVALTQVTQVLTYEPRAHHPPALRLIARSLSVRKRWNVTGKTIEPRLDLYNVTNESSILGRIHPAGTDLRPGEQHPAWPVVSNWA